MKYDKAYNAATERLLGYFVDGTALDDEEMSFLADDGLIYQVQQDAWQLTELGKQILKNQT